jgi:hypothetical protein
MVGGEATTTGDTVVVSDSHSSHVTFDFNGNHISGSLLSAYTFLQPTTSTATASMVGKFRNNFIGTAGSALSGSKQGDGIDINATGAGTVTMNVTGNDIRQYFEFGMNLEAGDTGIAHLNVTVTGNTVKEPGAAALQGIMLNAGKTSDAIVVCADIGGSTAALFNNAVGAGLSPATDFRIRQRNNSVVTMPGLSGTTTAAVNAYILGRNTAGATASSLVTAPAGGSIGNTPGGAACTQAP